MVLYFMVAYGAHVFIVSVMIRTHQATVAQAGALFGVVAAIGAIVGNLGGGVLADRLAARDVAWFARLTGWGFIAACPFFEAALLSPTLFSMAVILLFAETLMWGIVPPMFAALHLICGSKRRAMSIAIAFFFANLIGLGLGPVIAGALSDELAQTYGSAKGLGYALMIVMTVFLPAGWFMLRVVRHVKADAED
jgi:MFS family permease